MRLADLEKYDPITVQCHDNPDADAIGAGFGLYCYFRQKGKRVRLIYSGANGIQKANLRLMVKELQIPIEYAASDGTEVLPGLLITVDCQYGAGNVTEIAAETIAVIDHHPIATELPALNRVQVSLGSCSTLVWNMLREEGFAVDSDQKLGTALYYGLYTDTNQFSEVYSPLDMDMREMVTYDHRLMMRFCHANITLEELQIAGIAMQNCHYNEAYRLAVIRTLPCDPNILGLISDFLMQVAEIDKCVVYSRMNEGYKLSVRSCVPEFNAEELVFFLTKDIGSGGGHYEKAGGYISAVQYRAHYADKPLEEYFLERMIQYFEMFTIIKASDYQAHTDEMTMYRRKSDPVACVPASAMVRPGHYITIRTLTENSERVSDDDTFFALEREGSIHIISRKRYEHCFAPTEERIPADYFANAEYVPHFKESRSGRELELTECARLCVPRVEFCVYIKKLTKAVKIFREWDGEHCIVGMPGDYLAVSADDLHNVFIEPAEGFLEKFEEITL